MDQPLRPMANPHQPRRRLDLPTLRHTHTPPQPRSLATRPPQRHHPRTNPPHRHRTRTRTMQHPSRSHRRQPRTSRNQRTHMEPLMLTCEITRKTCNKRQHRKSKTRAATHLVSAFFDRAEAAAGEPGRDNLASGQLACEVTNGGAENRVVRDTEPEARSRAGRSGDSRGRSRGSEPGARGGGQVDRGSGRHGEAAAGSASVVVGVGSVDVGDGQAGADR